MITAAGAGSGIDVESILSQLNQLNRQPVTTLNAKRAELDVELSAYGTVKSALSSLQTAAKSLSNTSDFGAFVATSSDEDIFTATSNGGSVSENLDIEVLALATNHRMASSAYASSEAAVAQGTYSFSSGDNSFDISLNSEDATLQGLRDAINDSINNSSVSASIVNVDGGSRLVLTSKNSGTEGTISVTDPSQSGGSPSDFSEITPATDASLIIHGFAVTSSSNVVTNAIDGVTLNLKSTGEAKVTTERDTNSLRESLNEFVIKYNSMSSTLQDLSNSGLQGDQLPRGIDTRMREIFFSEVELPNGDKSNALALGFSFDRDGVLSIDETKYNTALDSGVDRFVEFFSSTDGVASKFTNLVDEYTQAGGIINSREDGVGTRKGNIDDQIERLEYRLDKASERLRKQFTAMDLTVTNLQSTSSFLTSRLSNSNV
ncbi:MAG: flagellar filament capping protein FliD [Granulosicoccus sp.]